MILLYLLGHTIGAFVTIGIISRLLKKLFKKRLNEKRGTVYASLLTALIAILWAKISMQEIEYYRIYVLSCAIWLGYDFLNIRLRKMK